MKNEINAVLENMTTTIPEPEDYTGEDGLLYCGKCRKPKEAYFAPDKAAIFGRDRHPAECDCQRTAREEREAAEKRRRHLDTVEELKQQIFAWAEEGRGTAYIARHLEAEKVPCPTWWNRKRGIRDHYTKWEMQDPENGKYVWDVTVLKDMLINPVYYGAVSSQKKKYRFKLGVLGEKKPEDWIIVEGMHDPIISQDTFDVVQEKIKSRQRPLSDGEFSLFAGLIKCGECGKALTIRKTNAKNPMDIYASVTYNKHGKHHCTQHRVEYDQLYEICLEEIRDLAQKAIDEEETAGTLAGVCESEQKAKTDAAARQIERAKSRLETLDRMTAKLYEDLLTEKIAETTFNALLKKTREEQELLEQ